VHHNQHYQHPLRKVFIKNLKSRWGSCSSRGNLNFNYKLVFLPPAVADYIIVHELCHLRHFNHSAEFWALVAETIPRYKEFRRLLRKVYL
jgi:predicted metal-dependent hydrolase